jgi:transposase
MNRYRYGKTQEISLRRELVGRMTLQGMTTREIANALANPPSTSRGLAYEPMRVSHNTVAKDQQALREAWRQSAAASISEHMAKQLAEIQEAKRRAWGANDLASLARFLKLELDLTGTHAPIQINVMAQREAANSLLDALQRDKPELYKDVLAYLAGSGPGQAHVA